MKRLFTAICMAMCLTSAAWAGVIYDLADPSSNEWLDLGTLQPGTYTILGQDNSAGSTHITFKLGEHANIVSVAYSYKVIAGVVNSLTFNGSLSRSGVGGLDHESFAPTTLLADTLLLDPTARNKPTNGQATFSTVFTSTAWISPGVSSQSALWDYAAQIVIGGKTVPEPAPLMLLLLTPLAMLLGRKTHKG